MLICVSILLPLLVLYILHEVNSPTVGVNVKLDVDALKVEVPHIVVGTPGRIMDLATGRKVLDLSHVKHFVLDECDRMLVRSSGFYELRFSEVIL